MKKPLSIIILFFISSLTATNTLLGQISLDVPRITPISPTATALEKYQSYPVDHCTGIPDITIPLYEIVAKDITIPVALIYHASGLKPKERSSFAGTGWTLNLEPSVTRQVLGIPDGHSYGWLFNPYSGRPVSGSTADMIKYIGEFADNVRDTQPDKFTYRLAQSGGAGYFTNINHFSSMPRNNDQITYLGDGITIIDPQGIIYNFDGAREKTGTTTTRWMCNTIESPNYNAGPLIRFFYHENSGFNIANPNSFIGLDRKVIVDHSVKGWESNVLLIDRGTYYKFSRAGDYPGNDGVYEGKLKTTIPEAAGGSGYGENPIYKNDFMTTARLEKVTFLGNELYVSYKGVGEAPLQNGTAFDAIEIRDENRNLIKKISFYITPYNSRTSLTKLDSVVISAPGAESLRYTFSYNSPLGVPSIYTRAVDHWGFCNGPEREGSIPTVPSFNQIINYSRTSGPAIPIRLKYAGANREPDHVQAQVGVLKSIANPYGAVTTFTYEGNYGGFRDDSQYIEKDYLHPVGGLRIQQIETHDSQTGASMVKTYKYGLGKKNDPTFKPIWGGGAIKHVVTQRDYHSSMSVRFKDDRNIDTTHGLSIYSSMPNSNITFNGGSAVMYNIVEETMFDRSGKGSIIRRYYNVKTHEYDNVFKWSNHEPSSYIKDILEKQSDEIKNQIVRRSPYHPHEPSDDFRTSLTTNQFYGAMLREEQIGKDYINGKEEVVLKKDYTYQGLSLLSGSNNIDIPVRHIAGNLEYLEPSDVFTQGSYEYSEKVTTCYFLDNETYRGLDRETIKEYYYTTGKVDSVTIEKKYEYNSLTGYPIASLEPKRIETKNSNNSVVVNEFKYLSDYPGILSEYKHSEANSFTESRILFKVNKNLPEKVQSRTSSMSDFRDHLTYDEYDTNGNVLQLTGKDGMPISFIWAYKGQYPIAEIRNATYAQVKSALNDLNGTFLTSLASKSAPLASDMSRINGLRNNSMLQNTHVSTFTYRPLFGILSETNPQGETIYYDYDSFGRLIRTYQIKAGKEETIEEYQYHYRGGN